MKPRAFLAVLILALPAAAQVDPTQELWGALDRTDLAGVRQALQRGADPNADNGRERILLRALNGKKWDIAEALLDAGASPRIADRAGCEKHGLCESIRPALHASFSPEMIAKLKARGLDLNVVSATGHTALTQLVVETPRAIHAVSGQAIGATVNSATGYASVTPATPPKVVEIPAPDNVARLRVLLDGGADANRKYQALTPLMLALATYGRPQAMVDTLIAAGGRIEHDAPVPKLADDEDFVRPVPPVSRGPVLMGADVPTQRGNPEGTLTGMRVGPLGWAVMVGRPEVALRLLERDRRIDAADSNLVYFASASGAWDLVLTALRHQGLVNVPNRAGVTPLLYAVDAGRADVVRAMLAAGADVRARSDSVWPPLTERNLRNELGGALAGHSRRMPRLVGGVTAMGVARARGHAEVIRVLQEAGAN